MNDQQFLRDLETGVIRVAQRTNEGNWVVDTLVKQRILDYFVAHEVVDMDGFVDKGGLQPRKFTTADKVRLVPGGSSVRPGTYIAPKVIIMPPSFVNIGAHVGEGTMIDSNVLVGSCAQIGKYVHLSAGVQIGGVLEPIGQLPVIIEDHAFIGANCAVVEGVQVGAHAVITPGTNLSAAVPIIDMIKQTVHKGMVPAGAVVVSGSRPLSQMEGPYKDIHIQCAVIVKYRDEKTSGAIKLEELLR